MANPPKKSIAIVGGGLAGLYAAWRITQDAPTTHEMDLYESAARFGGRVRSQKMPGIPFRAELGAMRFRTNHRLLVALIDALGIGTQEFALPKPAYYVRGRRFGSGEVEQGCCRWCDAPLPFKMKATESEHGLTYLVCHAICGILRNVSFVHGPPPNLPNLTPESLKEIPPSAWEAIKATALYRGIPLRDIGFWNLLQHSLSNEAFLLVHELLGLESIVTNWNAAEAVQWFVEDFASDEFLMMPEGTQTLVDRLADSLPPSCLHLNWTLCQLDWNPGPHSPGWTLTSTTGDQRIADQVVLALPRAALKRITVSCKDRPAWPPEWLNTVQAHPMFKCFLLYRGPWWRSSPWWSGYFGEGDTGRVYTDLPLRQVYYFGPSWMQRISGRHKDTNASSELSLIMASYSDEHYVSFWEPLRLAHSIDIHADFHQTEALWEEEFRRTETSVQASRRMVDKIQGQLRSLHGGFEIESPICGVYKYWAEEEDDALQDFGGGWHTWRVGSQPREVRKDIIRAYPSLFVCGEAFASVQGWMDSALRSVEATLACLEIEEHDWGTKHRDSVRSYLEEDLSVAKT